MNSQAHTLPWMEQWAVIEGTKPRGGGQGSIKQVRGINCSRLGALKEMLPDPLDREERRVRMAREVAGLIKVQGEGVPEVYDSNANGPDSDEELYLVQAWIDGVNLQQNLTKPLPIDEALQLTSALAQIVKRCHASGVLHRDIKPDNIIVDSKGELYLVDFGIAWLPPEDRQDEYSTKFGQELGNRFLRLPEMAAGQNRDNPRSDVTFVVGILFYLLTREYPRTLSFAEDGLPPHKHLRQALPAKTRGDPRMTNLNRIFDVGFQYVPKYRFQSIDQLIDRIEQILVPRELESASDLAQSVANYVETMRERETATRHEILMAMRESAIEFEKIIRSHSAERELTPVMTAGGPARQNEAWVTRVEFRHVTDNQRISALHTIRLEGSDIVCTSDVDNQRSVYYQGPAADVVGLHKEVIEQADIVFARVLDTFVKKVNARRTFMDLFD